ncbi:hypothetical protein [Rhizobium gallicum]|uniref:hypothetical protein n=1 Tax=Rhizobium gallicum TaxID=56730 RepID=UPI001EF8C234|nr:hypothetical protein [Rhizobium gallicum]ULJ72587.1 hypothetical protein L2W42_02475 [Rhizobium gallicum]
MNIAAEVCKTLRGDMQGKDACLVPGPNHSREDRSLSVKNDAGNPDGFAKGGDPFPPLSGLMSMCAECHNIKTNAVDHPNASGFRRALKGFDVDGNPN